MYSLLWYAPAGKRNATRAGRTRRVPVDAARRLSLRCLGILTKGGDAALKFWNMTLATLLSFAVTFAVVRLIGKKQVSTMTFWDLVSAIALGSLAANIIISTDVPLFNSAWVVVLWGGLAIATGWAALQNRKFRSVVQGMPAVLIANGKLCEDVMRRERLNLDLLMTELRAKGVFSVSEVEFALLEPNGKISVLKKSQNLPVTPKDLSVATGYKGVSTALVLDGQVIEKNLKQVGLDHHWLTARLAARGITDPADVFYAELGTDGTLYVDRRQDGAVPKWTQH